MAFLPNFYYFINLFNDYFRQLIDYVQTTIAAQMQHPVREREHEIRNVLFRTENV